MPELIGTLKSQSPYGAMWFATKEIDDLLRVALTNRSQSPYGAMWFATLSGFWRGLKWSRNPLTGLSGLQLNLPNAEVYVYEKSQSPYGAKWFATPQP
jgi:hypothetical protein